LVNGYTVTLGESCETIRADRSNTEDQGITSFSSAKRKPLPEPFVSTDDSGQHHGSSLCVPKGPSRIVTNHFDATLSQPRIKVSNLAGVPSETDVACHKAPTNQIQNSTAVNKSGTLKIIIILLSK